MAESRRKWQPHQGFEALDAQIKTCLVYSHFAKKLIPDGELIDAFLICIKQTGYYQTGYPENKGRAGCDFHTVYQCIVSDTVTVFLSGSVS